MDATMTKRFALPDTLPNPYITIYAGGTVTVDVASLANGRTGAEIWCDGKILCRVVSKPVQFTETTSIAP